MLAIVFLFNPFRAETCSLMMVSEERDCPVKQMTSEDFELIEIVTSNSQRIDDDTITRQELDEIQSAKGCRIRVLSTTGQTDVQPLDLKRQTGNVIRAKRKLQCGSKRFD